MENIEDFEIINPSHKMKKNRKSETKNKNNEDENENIDENVNENENANEKVKKEGYVYFIYMPEQYKKGEHYIKIGITINLEKRLGQLQTGCPYKLVIYKTYQSENYRDIETNLHQKYHHKQKLNEWFSLTFHEVDKEIRLLNGEPEKKWYQKLWLYITKK